MSRPKFFKLDRSRETIASRFFESHQALTDEASRGMEDPIWRTVLVVPLRLKILVACEMLEYLPYLATPNQRQKYTKSFKHYTVKF